MFSVAVNIDGLVTKMDTLALSARDLDEPLRRFGAYMRKKAIAKYERQNFAPLADATVMARARGGRKSLEGKLYSDVRKAQRRQAARGERDKSRGTANRLAVLAAYQEQRGFKRAGIASGVLAELTFKQALSLGAREDRAITRAVGKPVLGGLPRTVGFEVRGGSMTLASRTHEKWTAAHNEGATVGHGAKLPERRTIEVEGVDLVVLQSILKSHLLLPFQAGLHGPAF